MSGNDASIAQALRGARERGVDLLDAQLMLARLLDRPRAWLIAHDDAPLPADLQPLFAAWLARRAAGEPLAYLFGEKEFHGLLLHVDARVLVPRPDTETLVDWALELLRDRRTGADGPPEVVDLGTGSGAIALAVKHAHAARVTAVDASADALDVARGNARRLALDIAEWASGDWWQPLAGRRFDLALGNPPYIADSDPHLAALAHEPASALRGGSDGLRDLRQIVAEAPAHLRAGGWLLLEHGWEQAADVAALLHAHGFDGVETRCDLGGQPRCTGGQKN